MHVLTILGTTFAIANVASLIFAPASTLRLITADVLMAGASILFWSATRVIRASPFELAFGKVAPTVLVRQGPYAWVRHPFYSSYLLAWIAGAVATESLIAVTAVAVMTAFYLVAIRREEASFLESDMHDAYAKYRAEVGCLLPRLWAWNRHSGKRAARAESYHESMPAPEISEEEFDLFDEFLAQAEEPDALSFNDWVQGHLDHEAALRRIRDDWRRANAQLPTLPDPLSSVDLAAGDSIGDFVLLRPLGRGGQGVVWEAREQTLGRHVALRLLRVDRVGDRDQLLRRTRLEAEGPAFADSEIEKGEMRWDSLARSGDTLPR